MLVVTSNDIPGYQVRAVFGEVFGVTVRARNVGAGFTAGLRSIGGGEIPEMTQLLLQSRNEAMGRMIYQAQQRGANAGISFRFDNGEIAGRWTEICAYGTAGWGDPGTEDAKRQYEAMGRAGPPPPVFFRTAPASGGATAPPAGGAGALGCPPRLRAGAVPVPGLSVVGRLTSSRFPPTSTTTVVRSSAAPSTVDGVCGGTSLAHSVSIHRVCTPNGSLTYARSRTTARWKGSTVAIPSTTVSSRARRARSSASVRVSPYTITLASNESKLPPITLPDSIPVSTRTPGPAGQRSPVTVPGAGRKPRPGSSPLIRNSIACPRGCGSAGEGDPASCRARQLLAHRLVTGVSSGAGLSS